MKHKRNKKIINIILGFIILFAISIPSIAEATKNYYFTNTYKNVSSNIVLNNDEKVENVYLHNKDNKNIAFNINNMLPGDIEKNYYCINISYEDYSTLKYNMEITDGDKEFADVLKCKVVVLNTKETLYEGLIKDMPKELNYELSFNGVKNEELYYEISTYIDTSVGNEYQNKSLELDFKWWIDDKDSIDSDGNNGDTDLDDDIGEGNLGIGDENDNQNPELDSNPNEDSNNQGSDNKNPNEDSNNQGSDNKNPSIDNEDTLDGENNSNSEIEEDFLGIQDSINNENIELDNKDDLESEIKEEVQGIEDKNDKDNLDDEIEEEVQGLQENDESNGFKICSIYPFILLIIIILLILKLIKESKENNEDNNKSSKKSTIAIIVALSSILCICVLISRLCLILPLTLLILLILSIMKLIQELSKKNGNKVYKKLVLTIVTILILIMALAITTFAIMKTIVKVENNIFNTGVVKININNGESIINDNDLLFAPGTTIEKDFFIANEGTSDLYYKIYFDNIDGKLKDIVEITIKDNNKILYSGNILELTRKNVEAVEEILQAKEQKNLTIQFYYPEEEENFSDDLELSFVIGVDAVQVKNNDNMEFN